jgi:hypothetical protein
VLEGGPQWSAFADVHDALEILEDQTSAVGDTNGRHLLRKRSIQQIFQQIGTSMRLRRCETSTPPGPRHYRQFGADHNPEMSTPSRYPWLVALIEVKQGVDYALPVDRRIASMTMLVERLMNCQTTSRFIPSCAPSRGKMNSTPISIVMP